MAVVERGMDMVKASSLGMDIVQELDMDMVPNNVRAMFKVPILGMVMATDTALADMVLVAVMPGAMGIVELPSRRLRF